MNGKVSFPELSNLDQVSGAVASLAHTVAFLLDCIKKDDLTDVYNGSKMFLSEQSDQELTQVGVGKVRMAEYIVAEIDGVFDRDRVSDHKEVR